MPDDDLPPVDPMVGLQALGEQLDAQLRWLADRCTAYSDTLTDAGVPAPLRPVLVGQLHDRLLAAIIADPGPS